MTNTIDNLIGCQHYSEFLIKNNRISIYGLQMKNCRRSHFYNIENVMSQDNQDIYTVYSDNEELLVIIHNPQTQIVTLQTETQNITLTCSS